MARDLLVAQIPLVGGLLGASVLLSANYLTVRLGSSTRLCGGPSRAPRRCWSSTAARWTATCAAT